MNGTFAAENPRTLPVSSETLRFGQGFFTTTAIDQSVPLWVDQHIHRLNQSLALLDPSFRLDHTVKEAVLQWPAVNQITRGWLRVQVWQTQETFQVMIEGGEQASFPPAPPMRLAVSSVCRHSSNPILSHKALGNWSYYLAEQESRSLQCTDVVILNENRMICETSRSNLFWVSGAQLFTPAATVGLLPGIGRDLVIQLACAAGIPVWETVCPVAKLSQAQEVFATNSVKGIVPVGRVLPCSHPWPYGPVTQQLQKLYREYQHRYVATVKKLGPFARQQSSHH